MHDYAWYLENIVLPPIMSLRGPRLLVACNVHVSWKYTHGGTRVEVHTWNMACVHSHVAINF